MKNKIAVAGCKHTTLDLIKGLQKEGFSIDYVITINSEKAKKHKVAGYFDLKPYLEEMLIPYYIANNYNLQSEEDKKNIKNIKIDILLCMGWQRLIPVWFLDILSVGAFGMHGSNKPLPHGRGRSPLNWSLIQDKKIFITNLFRYNPGMDDGDIVATQYFEITSFDDALTLHFKNLVAMIKLCSYALPKIISNDYPRVRQKENSKSFYPKRTEDDGLIFWEDATFDIYNLIRAVTKPFPGAFTFYESQNGSINKLKIWSAIPFDTHLRWDDMNCGQICECFFDGSFIVKTGDTSLLVRKHEGIEKNEIIKGLMLHSNNILRKQWVNLPR
ncbi:MAG: hypothetical protein A2275_12035 [Bacteroidetes bacterium RIFOXYA12_FULL_35_11]|nr:MAG: hypothetical protein A2X01_17325 [Bacteroidetes bacterium GWF2_35_48]OFY77645.1 MAG: hypothetical protein A2275_12035 [Bacteroidetes bacterium RIFOXYA12_FULL_35_11]OFY94082.1 MAG: hypothetical protein A2309_11625 [Bacteroidetes bacterium RIFOXYB2_FULL_35_7]OFZ00134.1 MAG: hypothetical protein A2491_19380 [Bacteroidetes bacterium RIFOXYC12_FULL_35_7]HBX53000.1 hypothetical protein [Bacteroidales bacterium]